MLCNYFEHSDRTAEDSEQLTPKPYDLSKDSSFSNLKWRRGKLWIKLVQSSELELASFRSRQWLQDRLAYSPVKIICIDPEVGAEALKVWADACEQANKTVFLRIPSGFYLWRSRTSLSWWVKRAADLGVAVLLLLLLSPVFLGLILLFRTQSSSLILTSEWCVGRRGKLFRLLRFQTITIAELDAPPSQTPNSCTLPTHCSAAPLEGWMRRYGWDTLPQLINVLRGEISLVGSRPWALSEAVQFSAQDRHQLSSLPGIIGAWQAVNKGNLQNPTLVSGAELDYLFTWSLWKDLKILIRAIVQGILGLNGYACASKVQKSS